MCRVETLTRPFPNWSCVQSSPYERDTNIRLLIEKPNQRDTVSLKRHLEELTLAGGQIPGMA